ncbi:MAG: hypothetical protein IPJ90_18240 [Anaerolineaceae bacterium]|nr:hypothetical protein [Anaerolineaceae bacterium]
MSLSAPTSLVALLGGVLILVGASLILAGLGVVTIKQYIHIERSKGAWISGMSLVLIGVILLITGTPENPPVLIPTVSPVADPEEKDNENVIDTSVPISTSYLEAFDASELSALWVSNNAQGFNIEDGRLAFDFTAPLDETWNSSFIEFKEVYKNGRHITSIQFLLSTTPPSTEQFAVIGFEADCLGGQLDIFFDQDARLIINDETGDYVEFDGDIVLPPHIQHQIKLQFLDGNVEIIIDEKDITSTIPGISCTNPSFMKFLAGGSAGGTIQGFIDDILIEFEP